MSVDEELISIDNNRELVQRQRARADENVSRFVTVASAVVGVVVAVVMVPTSLVFGLVCSVLAGILVGLFTGYSVRRKDRRVWRRELNALEYRRQHLLLRRLPSPIARQKLLGERTASRRMGNDD
jgi:Flp pilus assembly protein TadB